MCYRKVLEKMKTHSLCSITFFSRKLHRLWDNVEKSSGDRGDTNDVTTWRIRVACLINKDTCTYAHAHAHAPGYPPARTHARTHAQACTHRPICNIYCFSTATVVSWTRLSVTLYVHWLYCYSLRTLIIMKYSIQFYVVCINTRIISVTLHFFKQIMPKPTSLLLERQRNHLNGRSIITIIRHQNQLNYRKDFSN